MGREEEAADKGDGVLCYILNPGYALRGWKLLPFALQYLYAPMTDFFLPDKYKLLEACDGKQEIAWDLLTEEEREQYEKWEKNGFIRRTQPGDCLKPYQTLLSLKCCCLLTGRKGFLWGTT